MKKTASRRAFEVFLYGFFVVVAAICFYPFWIVSVSSLQRYDEFIRNPLALLPYAPTVGAYALIFREENILGSFTVSLYITVFGTLLSLAVTTGAGYSLSKRYLKGGRVILFLFFFTALFEGGLIPLYFVVRRLGMLNTLWALMIPPLVNTFFLLIMRSFFLTFPESLVESAKIEGCSDYGILARIVVPLSKAVFAVIGLFYAVERWNDFFYALMFNSKKGLQPLQLVVYNLISPGLSTSFGGAGNDLSLTEHGIVLETIKMAAVVVAVVPIICIYPFIQKHFTEGALIGSLKE
jgi:putative aldouronate transport system permease protein